MQCAGMAGTRRPLTPEQERLIKALRRAVAATDRAAGRRDELVRETAAAGASWSTIGDALGLSAQAAHKRYGKGVSS
jgi:uncharacterized protein with PIN domain